MASLSGTLKISYVCSAIAGYFYQRKEHNSLCQRCDLDHSACSKLGLSKTAHTIRETAHWGSREGIRGARSSGVDEGGKPFYN